MKESMPWTQLAKYFAGELSSEENQKIEFWINADPKRVQQARKLYKIWKESDIPAYHLDVDESWSRLSKNMDKLESETNQFDYLLSDERGMKTAGQSVQRTTDRRTDKMKRLITLTAAAATILVTFLFAYNHDPVNQEIAAEDTIRQFVTKDGEWATYDLSDGSKVFLHPGSRLEVPGDFNVENRELFLEGEAYFEVAHDSDNPFLLNAKHTYTRVLGTKFLVQAWGPDEEVEVIVSEGKVALGDSRSSGSGDTKEAIITRSQRGVLTRDEGPVVTDVDDLDWYLGWTKGQLIFDDRPLSEIIFRLEHWYAVEIQFEDKNIGAKKITGEINNRQPMNEVLTSIAMSLDLEFEKENRTVTFQTKEQDH
ncbi:MAG: FecR domain-containing protein [Balneolales bacterium]